MPHVVDSDVYHDHGRVLREHIAIKPLLEVGHLVSADARPDDCHVQFGSHGCQSVADLRDVAVWAGTCLRDRVAQEDDPIALAEGDYVGLGGGGGAHPAGDHRDDREGRPDEGVTTEMGSKTVGKPMHAGVLRAANGNQ